MHDNSDFKFSVLSNLMRILHFPHTPSTEYIRYASFLQLLNADHIMYVSGTWEKICAKYLKIEAPKWEQIYIN
jgi:hypothetical protein